jgi:hypothetical protein
MARGNVRQDIFLDEANRELLIETPDGRLVSGMRRLNGAYTQGFNHRHGCVGHFIPGYLTVEDVNDLDQGRRHAGRRPGSAACESKPPAIPATNRQVAKITRDREIIASSLSRVRLYHECAIPMKGVRAMLETSKPMRGCRSSPRSLPAWPPSRSVLWPHARVKIRFFYYMENRG